MTHADFASRDEMIRELRTRIRTVQKLADHYSDPTPPGFGTNSVAALLQQQWIDELIPAAEELHECSRRLLQQLPYAAYSDLPVGPRGVLSESEDLARDLGEHAHGVAQTPVDTGNQQTNDALGQFLSQVGRSLQDTGSRTRATNRALADQKRAEQDTGQGGDRS